MHPCWVVAKKASCKPVMQTRCTWLLFLGFNFGDHALPSQTESRLQELHAIQLSQAMTETIRDVLQAMDNIANVPALLSARLLQPAPVPRYTQSASDLTPPKVVRRKRQLTLPLDTPAPDTARLAKWLGRANQQRTCDQSQSALMRLPAELREQIWKDVILGTDDGVIELGWRSTGRGRGRASAYKVTFEKPRDEWGTGVLGMLCSCRVIYSEAIGLLYSLPTFSFRFQNIGTFLAFVCAIPPHRREQIKYLDLCWLNQPKAPSGVPQGAAHRINPLWSYKRICNVKALSELPRPEIGGTDFVHAEWVVKEILKGMKGLEKGGIRWGSLSTGCLAQERAVFDSSI
ncbi:hypothetical protein BU25DRAFT_88239 [Macroventuria anomochaeta]|uniref:Uncharacterized protein n=1 Tax=Macroventuria anomochaeta TaxID=301207 RepID=A0ACB6SGH7_9PLEO|nr:uncharacterized protein BU25DRAFT_88239 [Macroventuria anomochaeta]KAF2633062.1 hypothetical protein BU25DRAFT_88239 [Macroventuria anomochaeta]